MKKNISLAAIEYIVVTLVFVTGFSWQFARAVQGPTAPGGIGNGAIGVDSSNNISFGTGTPLSDTKVLVKGATSDATTYAAKFTNAGGSPLLYIRDDGRLSINTSTITSTTGAFIQGDVTITGILTAGGTAATVTAGNVSAGIFGSNTGGGTFFFPGSVSINTTSTPTSTLTVAGEIKTTTGGVRFPDGSLQTTAASGGGIPSGYMILGSSGSSAPSGYTYAGMIGDGAFSSKAALPSARIAFGAAATGTKIYMIGGYTTPATYLTKLDSYDTVADSWDFSSKIPMDRAGGRFQAVAVGNKIYVPNGWFWTGAAYAATTTLRIYDIDANSWSKGTPSPDARYNTAAAVVGNKIYVMGGYNAFGSATSSVYEYDTQTTLWTRKANMPTAQALISAAVINTTIYLISDFYFYAYDTTTDTWSTKSSAPTTHGVSGSSLWPTLSAAYGKIYAFNLPSKFVDIYDPVSDSWNISFVNNASRENTVAVTVSNAIYSLGGGITSNPTSTNTGLTIGQYNLYQKN